jgi:O-antigen biosynthesis protein
LGVLGSSTFFSVNWEGRYNVTYTTPFAFVLHNLNLFETIEPLLMEAPEPFDLYLPRYNDPQWHAMSEYTYQVLRERGYFPKFLDQAYDQRYKVVFSGLPYAGSDNRSLLPHSQYNVRFMYGLAKETFTYDLWNINYDLILCFGPYDESILKGYTQTIQVGPIRFINHLQKRDKKKNEPPNLLYVPTYGPPCSLEKLAETLKELNDSYHVTIRLHHGTTFLEPERVALANSIGRVADPKIPLGALLEKADVVLSDGSGAIFDALAMNCPVVVFQPLGPAQFEGKPSLEELIILEDIVPSTDDPLKIKYSLKQAMEDPEYTRKRKEFVKKIYLDETKISVKRVWETIYKLLSGEYPVEGNYYAQRKIKRRLSELSQENARLKSTLHEFNTRLEMLKKQYEQLVYGQQLGRNEESL